MECHPLFFPFLQPESFLIGVRRNRKNEQRQELRWDALCCRPGPGRQQQDHGLARLHRLVPCEPHARARHGSGRRLLSASRPEVPLVMASPTIRPLRILAVFTKVQNSTTGLSQRALQYYASTCMDGRIHLARFDSRLIRNATKKVQNCEKY